MGEVYRATDTQLKRSVAIKVLPDALSADPDRLARFQREAEVLAALNHPNIAQIYGLERGAGQTTALVMELVEGPTLAERIFAGPIPIDEALSIARQICEALEGAHEQGVVHRDLKPSNVKVRSDGTVKVLDFGLAKAMRAELETRNDVTVSPTVTAGAATMEGVILGTAAYMSPEQAKGKAADQRSDVWAFGCVFYEMLTGRRAFGGNHVSEVLAAVLRDEPDWNRITNAPPTVTRLLRRCLQRDPRRRLHHIADARIEIEEALAEANASVDKGAAIPGRANRRRAIGLTMISLVIGGVIGALAAYLRTPALSGARPVSRFVISVPATERPAGLTHPIVTLSADGTRLAWVADNHRGTDQIFVRQIDRLTETPIPGTDSGHSPFFSPDGKWLGFFAEGKLKKVSLAGGTPIVLADAPDAHGGSWGEDGTIVFAPTATSPLSQVSAEGGSPRTLTMLDIKKGETAHRWPSHVPGAHAIMFTVSPADGGWDESEIAVQSLDTGSRHMLLRGGANARYVPTGHLVYVRAATLNAVSFDRDRLAVAGDPIPVVDGILTSESSLAAHFAFSSIGTLVYVPASVGDAARRLVWVDRSGASVPLPTPARPYSLPRLSPDGRHIVAQVEGINNEIWLWDTARAALTRLTLEGSSSQPVWSPDGKTLTFNAVRGNTQGLFEKAIDGSAKEERLGSTASGVPHSWSPDGQWLSFHTATPTTRRDLWLLPRDGDRTPRLLLGTPHDERVAMFSPDGKWLAYLSDESGREEVYVQAFPSSGGRWQVSTDGGSEPVWARSGRELFYRSGNTLMSVDIEAKPTFSAGVPKRLFESRFVSNVGRANYDVSVDGKQFLMVEAIGSDTRTTQVNVVQEWFEELKRRRTDHP
jgi:eukaryotic-like serine/threonine-protein kinase